MIPKIEIQKLECVFAQLERQGVKYGLGAKAEGGRNPNTGQVYNPRSAKKLNTPLKTIEHIDCSGAVRFLLAYATDFQLAIPDGSQNQRAWFEAQAKNAASGIRQIAGDRVTAYTNAARYVNPNRLFCCFIRPGYHGCGEVGHVWLLSHYDDGNNGTLAGTLESHGGTGINSRPWNSRTLIQEVYSTFELPTK